ncbi:MAG: hypothetical protein SFX73_08390 [Kofleriaceae bacterium]|nr:hypothetical protein [Kofleriaceae bacterium]
MESTDIGLEIFKLLSPILLGAFTWVAAKLGQWINARVRNEYLRGVLTRLDDTVVSVVREIHQVTVDALKAATVDGKLPPSARDTVKQAAISAIKSHLGAKGLNELARVLGLDVQGVDRLIGTKIEATVHDIKTQQRFMNGVNHGAGAHGDAVPFPG